MVSEVLGCLSEYWLLKEHAFALRATSKLVVPMLAKLHLLPACGAPDTKFLCWLWQPSSKLAGIVVPGLDWFEVFMVQQRWFRNRRAKLVEDSFGIERGTTMPTFTPRTIVGAVLVVGCGECVRLSELTKPRLADC